MWLKTQVSHRKPKYTVPGVSRLGLFRAVSGALGGLCLKLPTMRNHRKAKFAPFQPCFGCRLIKYTAPHVKMDFRCVFKRHSGISAWLSYRTNAPHPPRGVIRAQATTP
jgi:hypothetical protein